MDPEKPKSDSPSESPSDQASARSRVERLDARHDRDSKDAGDPPSGNPPSKATSSDGPRSRKAAGGPQLTERQRIEARERRRQDRRVGRRSRIGSRRSRGSDGGPTGNVLSRGIRATWMELRRTAGFFWDLILTGLEGLGPAVRFLTGGLVALLAATGRVLAGLGRIVARVFSRIGAALLVIDRVVTPRRALIAVAGAAAAALIASQFIDFRATEIGRPGYDLIRDITHAPRTDVLTPINAHSISLLLIAGLALVGVAGTALTGRRVFAAAIAFSGAVTIAVALLVDLPKGLDVAVAEISYSGVAAVLLAGFWIELAAGLVLAFGGLGLMLLAGSGRVQRPDRGRSRGRSDGDTGDRESRRAARRENSTRPADAGGIS